MSEFRVNSITNQDGSAGILRYVVSQHSVESLVFRYQVDEQSFVDKMVVEEEEEYLLEVISLMWTNVRYLRLKFQHQEMQQISFGDLTART